MIIVQLTGGLGNQLFQYAAGCAVAMRNNIPLKLDVRDYIGRSTRRYTLDKFNITAEIATEAECTALAPTKRQPLRRIYHEILQRVLPYHRRPLIEERSRHYDPAIELVRDNAYLRGYWQSYKYFEPISETLRHEFSLKVPPDVCNRTCLEEIRRVSAVSLHVRRGDYANDSKTKRAHGLLTETPYYETAIQYICDSVDTPHFFVFSDDIDWVRQNLDIPSPAVYVDFNGAEQDYEDLRLMSACRHHIIANSTFSWWGAWLAGAPDKIVVAPKQWFASEEVDYASRYPNRWTLI